MFSEVMAGLLALFQDRLFTLSGYAGETLLAGCAYQDRSAADALAEFRSRYGRADRVMLKTWSAPALEL